MNSYFVCFVWDFLCPMFKPSYSVKFLCHYGLCELKTAQVPKLVSGSSAYKFEEGELLLKKSVKYEQKEATKRDTKLEKEVRQYSLNKKVVKRKMFALYHLPNAKRYFRLWTLTFPEGTSDEIGYKILNNWLTRMRQELGLKHYIWVAERQKNGTLHFHLTLCQFMNIAQANYFAKVAINKEIKKGNIISKVGQYENYNGLDISKKCGDFEQVAKYLTKYITKNNTTSSRLPYYCSQTVSRLFTTEFITDEKIEMLEKEGLLYVNNSPLIQGDMFNFYAIKVNNYEVVFANLFAINALVIELKDEDIGFI